MSDVNPSASSVRGVAARARGVAAAALTVALGCGHGGPEPLTLPRNWDDRVLDVPTDGSLPRPTLAVVPFAVSERVRAETDLLVGPMLTTALLKTGRFDLVEADKIDQILAQQEFQQAAYFDVATKAKLGRMVGASAVLFGELTSATQQKVDKFAYDVIDTRIRIDVRAVDTSTGRVIFAESAEGRTDARVVTDARGNIISGALDTRSEFAHAAADAAVVLGQRLSGEFPVTGFVLSGAPERFVVDLGSAKALAPGDELVVIRPLERLRHPVTGQPVGWSKIILGRARVEVVELSTATAHLVQAAAIPERLRPGDRVVLKRKGQ
jgi:hypothetical protein